LHCTADCSPDLMYYRTSFTPKLRVRVLRTSIFRVCSSLLDRVKSVAYSPAYSFSRQWCRSMLNVGSNMLFYPFQRSFSIGKMKQGHVKVTAFFRLTIFRPET